ncbi:hypothetical protein B0H13DRAFT_2471204, partial [Mycena leptocephala]
MVSFLSLYGWTIVFHNLLAVLAVPGIVSSSWRKPNVTLSSSERIHLASAALEQSASIARTVEQFRATVYYEMAEFDIATKQTTYAQELQQYLPSTTNGEHKLAVIESLGHAAIRAYTAYKNSVFLELANQTWTYVRSYTISADEIVSGSMAGKNFSLATICQGATMLGGTFDTDNTTDSSVTGFASTYFFALSAFLAEATSLPMYLDAAMVSLDFISAHLSAQNIVQNGISASLMIQGLAVLCSITSNTSTQALLDNFIVATISNDQWQTTDGIIAQGVQKQGDKYLMRGLAAAFTRNTTSPDLRPYLHDYIGVQFNAVIDLATSNGNNVYAGVWTGPPSALFSQSNQTNAISALLGGIALNDPDPTSTAPGPFPSGSGSASGSPQGQQGRSTRIAVIVGAICGSVALVAIGIAVWFILRHRARAMRPASSPRAEPTSAIHPFPTSIYSPTRPFRADIKSAAAMSPGSSRTSPTSESSAHHRATDGDGPVQSPAGDVTANPLTELVRMLAERLSQGVPARRWDEEEVPPPEYGTR